MSHVRSALRVWTVAAVAMWAVGAGTAAHSASGPQISRSIGKEMQAAQTALKASQWSEAIKSLEAAEKKPGLTAFDKTTIADFKGFAYARLSNYKAAQQAYEEALADGAYTPDQVAQKTRIVFRLAFQNQQYQKAIEYGKKVSDAGGANGEDLAIMGQTYYLLKDCKNAGVWIDKAVASARKAGEAPKETYFQIKLRCAFDANDTAGTEAALEDLIKLTNKTEYWNQLIRFMRQDEKEDRGLLMVYRVMYNTNSMNALSDYVEMSQLLLDAALPGEALAVLQKAFASNMVTPDQKDRTTRLLNAAQQRADVDKKGLPQFEAEAAKNKVGEADIKLGEVYYGFGDYQNAVNAIQRGFEKGQIKHADEAYVYLGLAQGALKNSAEAKKAFAALKTLPGVKPAILKLWQLYAEKQV